MAFFVSTKILDQMEQIYNFEFIIALVMILDSLFCYLLYFYVSNLIMDMLLSVALHNVVNPS